MTKAVSIVVADDHPIVLLGVETLLNYLGYKLEGKFSDGISCLNYISVYQPEIAIIDIRMPGYGGIEVIKHCIKNEFKTRFIVFTMDTSAETFNKVMGLGVKGYLLKDDATKSLNKCIQNVLNGKLFCSKGVRTSVNLETKKINSNFHFTEMELRVLGLIAIGRTSKEIAETLYLSNRTIDAHRFNISKKIGLKKGAGTSLKKWVIEHSEEFML